MFALLLLFAAFGGAFVVHAFRAIEISYWQRKAMLYAITDMDGPRETLRKLEILREVDWGAHVSRVTTFRDPWVLYSALPDEVGRLR